MGRDFAYQPYVSYRIIKLISLSKHFKSLNVYCYGGSMASSCLQSCIMVACKVHIISGLRF